MPVWVLVVINLLAWYALAQALVTGRIPGTVILFKVTYAGRRDNPVFYWLFTGMLTVICVFCGLRLAEALVPGFHAPGFLG